MLTSQEKKEFKLEAELEALKHSLMLKCIVHQVEEEGLYVADKCKVEQFCSGH